MMPRIWRGSRDIWNLRASSYQWYRVVRNGPGPAEITIYDEISPFGVTAQDFLRDLADIDGPINLRLNSPGGDVYDGIAIYNALAQRTSQVTVMIDGIAASITSVIAQAASPGQLNIAKRGQMMIHDAFSMGLGNSSDLRHIADELDRQSDNLAGIYSDRTGQPAQHWRDLMRAETTYFGQEAVDAGLADKVYEAPVQNLFVPVIVNADGNHASMTGTHSHSHPAYGSQGSDSSHSHEHSHDGDASHNHSHSDDAQDMLRNAANAGWQQRDGKYVFDPDNDGDDDSTASGDTDHDYFDADGNQIKAIPPNPATGKGGKPLPPTGTAIRQYFAADKYKQADRDDMAKSGEAMPDGSYPIKDAEDLDNAIHAVGRGNADHDDIRAHIIKRAKALGLSSEIPGNWNADGSLSDGDSSNQLAFGPLASLFNESLKGGSK